jgi:S-methylmethionine-dependent homocysteine/selenocysteine methylase/SAM-dependent methyltransferase
MKLDQAGGYGLVRAALAAEQCIVLDGGVATELEHEHGQDHERLWGIEALACAPDAVARVHRSYVEAGVDVVTTNTWALPTLMTSEGSIVIRDGHRSIHWMEIARRGIGAARDAIRDCGREGEVAVAFSVNSDLDGPEGPETIALLARAFADEPPDLILFETLSVLRPSLFDVIQALNATSIPLWVSFRRCPHGLCGVYGQHWGGPEGDAFGRAARRFEEMGVAALLVNCIPPDHVPGMVSHLRDFTDMPLGVYPNLGYYTSAGWQTESEIGGREYAEMALQWRAEGARIIGGCCGTRPEHIAAAREALASTAPGHERYRESVDRIEDERSAAITSGDAWVDNRDRELHPLLFPVLARHRGVAAAIPGSFLMWRYLFEEGIGAHQRCLDIGSGCGLQTIQLALNGAAHVHAIDLDERAVSNTLDNAFRNGVADRVTAEVADLYPWLPDERYELVVANVPQVPTDPASEFPSHRPTDYWGRGLVDQLIAKLPRALAREGRALLTLTSVVSRARTLDLLDQASLASRVVAWDIEELPKRYRAQREHIATITHLTDAYTTHIGDEQLLVCYLLEITHRRGDLSDNGLPPWLSASKR